jgi:bifunctional diaminopimelate decarboxylase / aspartate kinase
MTSHTESNWVVLKFGGSSVSSVSNWKNVAGVIRERLAAGVHPFIVHSALTGITDRLEQLLDKALTGDWEPVMDQIERRHMDLARDLGLDIDRRAGASLLRSAQECRGHPPDRRGQRSPARTRDGERRTHGYAHRRGIPEARRHRRRVARCTHTAACGERPGASDRSNYLSATCNFEPDAAFQERLAAGRKTVITQGFIASDSRGDTVLLGRGGSDTSGSYFAAKLVRDGSRSGRTCRACSRRTRGRCRMHAC